MWRSVAFQIVYWVVSVFFVVTHQCRGDGFVTFSQAPDLGVVTGHYLLNFPRVGPLRRRMGAIVVNNCGSAGQSGRRRRSRWVASTKIATDRPNRMKPLAPTKPDRSRHSTGRPGSPEPSVV